MILTSSPHDQWSKRDVPSNPSYRAELITMIPPVIQRKTPLGRIVDYDIKEAYSSDTDDHALAALQTSHINPDMKIKTFHRVTIYIWVHQERRAACGDKRQLPKPVGREEHHREGPTIGTAQGTTHRGLGGSQNAD